MRIALTLCLTAAFMAVLPRGLRAAPRALRICDDVQEPAGLDPFGMVVNKSDNILNQMYEGLVRLGPRGEPQPALAERWERLDERRVRFHLRPDVVFHDGAPLTADAVRDSLERQQSAGGSGALQIASIEKVEVESPSTLVIKTREPDGVLLHRLAAFARIAEVSPGAAAPPGDAPPPGTGPFRFDRWERGKRIVLKAHPGYWSRRKSPFGEVSFEFLPESEQAAALAKGEPDLVTELPGTKTLEIAGQKSLKVVKARVLATQAFWFVAYRGALADRRVRHALNLAIDKRELIRYAALGNGRPLASLSMPGQVGHNSALRPYPYDLSEARRLLKEAGWGKGFKLRGLIIQQSEREAKIIAEQLKRLGIVLDLDVLPIAEVFRLVQAGKLREYDLTANLAPDPAAHLYFLAGICYYSRSPFSAGGVPGFDERYEAMLRATDPEENRKAAEKLDAWIQEEALGLFTYQRTRTFGMRSTLDYAPSESGMLHVEEIAGALP